MGRNFVQKMLRVWPLSKESRRCGSSPDRKGLLRSSCSSSSSSSISSSSSSSSTSSASSSSSSSASEPEMVINRDQVYSYRMLSDADHEFQHVPLADEEEEVEEETASTEQPELFAGNTIPSFEMRWDDSEPFDAALDQPIQ
mmetsp:Transcript_18832/g.47899  ORF Transcript_18832/g.47899 Transcript_18832/m.47899 type:complete len:142 (-) Transcript_18832:51-476(-)